MRERSTSRIAHARLQCAGARARACARDPVSWSIQGGRAVRAWPDSTASRRSPPSDATSCRAAGPAHARPGRVMRGRAGSSLSCARSPSACGSRVRRGPPPRRRRPSQHSARMAWLSFAAVHTRNLSKGGAERIRSCKLLLHVRGAKRRAEAAHV